LIYYILIEFISAHPFLALVKAELLHELFVLLRIVLQLLPLFYPGRCVLPTSA
jgi:hypothetical protein